MNTKKQKLAIIDFMMRQGYTLKYETPDQLADRSSLREIQDLADNFINYLMYK